MEFIKFKEIENIRKFNVTVTQKLHGTNASIFIFRNEETNELDLRTGKRTSFCTPELDNAGFANFVYANKAEIIDKLGEGSHYGEWVGPGVNSSEGLVGEKRFVLFDVLKFQDKQLPNRVDVVPLLYSGRYSDEKIIEIMDNLKTNGSKYVKGFMRPEGVVIHILGTNIRFKNVFSAEETEWTKGSSGKEFTPKEKADLSRFNYLLQPIRLEKVLSSDSLYLENYPQTLKQIVDAYWSDLIKENQVEHVGIDDLEMIRKSINGSLFLFVKREVQDIWKQKQLSGVQG